MANANGAGEDDRRRDEPTGGRKRGLSMHEGIAIWCDCCSCEAEERWVQVGKELGIDMSDYEPEESE